MGREQHYLAPPPPLETFFSDTDEVMLEDESGRIRLIGDVIEKGAGIYVTGRPSPSLSVLPWLSLSDVVYAEGMRN